MPKNPKSKSKAIKKDEPMNGAMKFFLAGCVAELYLLIVRRFYVNGSAEQQIAWFDSYLKRFIGAGVVVLAIGLVLAYLWRQAKAKRELSCYVAGLGAFVALSSTLVLWNMSALSPLSVIVPVVMVLGILWSLYDRECALSLTILCVSLIALWICRRQVSSMYLGTYVKVLAVAYIVVLAVIAFLVKQGKLGKLLPAKADPLPVYVACGLSVVGMLCALLNATIAYYAMWCLAFVVFALAVYYTVKQL